MGSDVSVYVHSYNSEKKCVIITVIILWYKVQFL